MVLLLHKTALVNFPMATTVGAQSPAVVGISKFIGQSSLKIEHFIGTNTDIDFYS